MKKYLLFLPVFVLYISVFRFIYLDNGLSLILQVCLPIIMGIIFASVLNPVLLFIQHKLNIKNRYLALLFTFSFVLLIISLIVTIITPSIVLSLRKLTGDIPVLFYRANKYLSDFGEGNSILKIFLEEIVAKFSHFISSILNFAIEKVINIVAALGNMLLAIIISIYILIDKEKIENWTMRLCCSTFGRKATHNAFKIMHRLYDNVSGYIGGKIISSVITGILTYVGSKYLLKNPYPVIDGVIIGVTNIIPYFGTLIGAVPILLINMLHDTRKGFLLLIYILMVQEVDSLVIDPRILSSRLSVKPIIVIISIIVGGGLFGGVGLFLATPVAALTKSLIDTFIELRLKEKQENVSLKK